MGSLFKTHTFQGHAYPRTDNSIEDLRLTVAQLGQALQVMVEKMEEAEKKPLSLLYVLHRIQTVETSYTALCKKVI